MLWNLVDFEDLVKNYFDYVAYDRVDVRDVAFMAIEERLKVMPDTGSFYEQQLKRDEKEMWSAVDSFYTELENHLLYFFGRDQMSLAFNKMHENALILEVHKHDERYDTHFTDCFNSRHT